ncbi:MAG: protein translocase subunit SecF [Deltaproteobacteria bacterium]|nr:protein translocase subunit SecF [Deltaproteobacteria bacterium]
MQFIKPGINIDFTSKKKIAFFISITFIMISIISLVMHKGPRYGVDFSGGTLIQVRFTSPISIDDIKKGLARIELGKSSVQQFGDQKENEYLIRTDKSVLAAEDFSMEMKNALEASTGGEADIRRIEMVGPQVGKDLREKALFAMFYALLFITIYISGRFELKWLLSGVIAVVLICAVIVILKICDFFSLENSIPVLIAVAIIVTLILFWFLELKYAMGAIVALIHDVTITVGIFSLMDLEFTLPIIAALLTIIGYSLNDTIIVFDRIRENQRKHHKKRLETVINGSINETLSRTILTSLTTLVVVVALFLMGGGIIHDFAFAMIIGVLTGTYSSIFVASPILLAWQGKRKKS